MSVCMLSYQQLSSSINSADGNFFYGSMPGPTEGALARPRTADETTSLILDRSRRRSYQFHLYDNIGFADSALLAEARSERKGSDVGANCASDYPDADVGAGGSKFRGKFRIFLAAYVLVGITLAIYSRNALSLAAVGLVANIVADKELVNILAASRLANRNTSSITTATQNTDGSCSILDKHLERDHQDASGRQAVASVIGNLPMGVNFGQADRYELERAFRLSIKHRIEQGQLVDWSPSEQGLVFAAGSVGNLLISIPITRMGEIYGPKWVIFVALSGATIQAALMPIVAPLHVGLVVLFQVIFSGLAFGADCVAYTLFAYWLTPTEIAFFVACLVVCYQLGAILSSVITAQILTRAIHWSWCFYVPAILCALWTFIWVLVGASEPSSSSIITKEEQEYLAIRSKLSQADNETRGSSPCTYAQLTGPSRELEDQQESCQEQRQVSWLKLAKDPNIWAIVAVKFTLRWYFSVSISLMPTYLSSVAHMSVDLIGKFSAMQSAIGLVSGIFMSYITKSVVSRRPFNWSLPAFRKVFQSVVNFGLALSLIIFTTFDCEQWVTIATLTMAGVCINFYVAAALQLPLDLSPKYCGLITSITNTLALGQVIGAPISGWILNSAPKNRGLWRFVWGISIVLNLLSGLIFILIVDSKPRDYSKNDTPRKRRTVVSKESR